jgi:hypothetical protein
LIDLIENSSEAVLGTRYEKQERLLFVFVEDSECLAWFDVPLGKLGHFKLLDECLIVSQDFGGFNYCITGDHDHKTKEVELWQLDKLGREEIDLRAFADLYPLLYKLRDEHSKDPQLRIGFIVVLKTRLLLSFDRKELLADLRREGLNVFKVKQLEQSACILIFRCQSASDHVV